MADGVCDASNNQECGPTSATVPAKICNCAAKYAPNAANTACESSVGKLKTKH